MYISKFSYKVVKLPNGNYENVGFEINEKIKLIKDRLVYH